MDSNSQEILEALQTLLLPWSRGQSIRLMSAQFPFIGAEGVPCTQTAEPALARPVKYAHSINPERWPELGLHACRYPSLGCVLQGETDIAFGVLVRPGSGEGSPEAGRGASAHKNLDKTDENRIAIFALSARDCFLIPAGVPYSDASRPHWRRPRVESAYARVLWLRALPMGAMIQISRTENGLQLETQAVLTKDPLLLTLVNVLISAQQRLPRNSDMLPSCLSTLFHSLRESLVSAQISTSDQVVESRSIEVSEKVFNILTEVGEVVVERARNYIHTNLPDPELNLTLISRSTYVSAQRLERLFQEELGLPVMKYVMQRRLEEAKTLLVETDITVGEISFLCGYRHRTHFSRLFAQRVGISPREFRQTKQFVVTEKRNSERVGTRKRDLRRRRAHL